MPPETCWIVAYDVAHPRRRYRVARLLEALGCRLQRSVFELWATPVAMVSLEGRLRRLLDLSADSVRMYPLGSDGGERPELLQRGWFIV